MTARNRFAKEERAARSRLTQVMHDAEFLCGSLVTMARRCGKKGCHCEQGEKHVSLYLSVTRDAKRRMVYIPPELEQDARQQAAAWRETQKLTQAVSDACVSRLLERKRNKKNGSQEK